MSVPGTRTKYLYRHSTIQIQDIHSYGTIIYRTRSDSRTFMIDYASTMEASKENLTMAALEEVGHNETNLLVSGKSASPQKLSSSKKIAASIVAKVGIPTIILVCVLLNVTALLGAMVLPSQAAKHQQQQWLATLNSVADAATTPTTTTTTGVTGGVLITGATGRTGSLLYFELLRRGVPDVRAFVQHIDRARDILGCTKCDASEGIYVGDVGSTNVDELVRASRGVSVVAIAVGASPSNTKDEQKSIEFTGVQHTVAALAQAENVKTVGSGSTQNLRVVLCSSMGSTEPGPSWSGDILHWKLNAEAFLMSAGIGFTIVKPCGLDSKKKGGMATLLTGHDDSLLHTDPPSISREDVAAVMAEAVVITSDADGLRLDLCSKPDSDQPVATDLTRLLKDTKWKWEQ